MTSKKMDILFTTIKSKEGYNMDYTFDLEDSIFNNPNRDIIKRLDFKRTNEFYDYCEMIIQSRIDIICKYNMVDYSDCINSELQELNRLEPIIIDCCFDDYYLIDDFANYFETKFDLHSLKDKYGILIMDL